MRKRTIWKTLLPAAALICVSAWGQTSQGANSHAGDSSDNLAAEISSPHKISELKKEAAKESRKNAAAAARAAKAASSAPK